MGNVVHHLFKHKFKHKPASSRKTEARPHTFCVSVVKGLKVILGSKDEEEEENLPLSNPPPSADGWKRRMKRGRRMERFNLI